MNDKNNLSVVPDFIYFRDLNPEESDAIDVWVTNKGKNPTQIRFSLSPNSKFSILTFEQPFTAPGLDSKAIIKYSCKDKNVIKENLFIHTPESTISIPILATPPCARILPDLTTIKMGSIGINTPSKFTFSISNIGVKDGDFILTCTDESVVFMPPNGNLQPNKSAEISGTIKPSVIGDFLFRINLSLKNPIVDENQFIDVSGTAVQHSLSLLVDGKETNELDFQTIFYGQKRVIDATVINHGPYKRSFVVLPPRDTPTSSHIIDLQQQNSTQEEVIFSAIPAEGLLNPYGSALVRFIFNPLLERPPSDDIESLFNQYSSIEVVETSQRIEFQLSGKAVHHIVSLSSIDFNFGTTSVKSKSFNPMTIINSSHFLHTFFEVKPVAHFRFEPSKGSIPPNQSKTIQIHFFPKNLGNFETSTTISFCEGLIRKKINLIGSATANGSEGSKFIRSPIWENDETTKFNVEHPDKKYTFGLDELLENKKKRQNNDLLLSESRKKREDDIKNEERSHKLRQIATINLEKTVGHFTDEDLNNYIKNQVEKEFGDIDAVIESNTLNGLEPPSPPIRNIEAPLFIPNPEKFGLIINESMTNQQALNSRSKVTTDDNILIKKKFKAKPSTPAEINECSHPLTPAQQLLVISSHETLNFGQISVFSNVAKSFTIANNLQQHILVSINYEYEELSQSGPLSQVIPPKQTAGFDIKFSSSKPQNFMKTLQYMINGCHSYSLNVCSQVIPIDLQLSRNIIEFRFSPDSNSPIIKEFISILNKSNARAEFTWTNISQPFAISQPNGSIEANKSLNVEITYNPTTKSHDETTIIMNVAGGTSKALK